MTNNKGVVREKNEEVQPTKPKVLIIDDDADFVQVARRLLLKMNFDPLYATSPTKGIEIILKENDIDLILIDWILPEFGGLDMLKVLRSKGIEIPVIVISAKKEAGEVVKAVKAGASYYLVKPVNYGLLVLKVNELVKAYREKLQNKEFEKNSDVKHEQLTKQKKLHLEASLSMTLVNISCSGCAFEAPFAVPKDSVICFTMEGLSLRLETPWIVNFPVRVVSVKEEAKKYLMGAQFVGLPLEVENKLKEICADGNITPQKDPSLFYPEDIISSNRKKAKILAIDDDPLILEFMKPLLAFEGFTTITTSNPREGLKILENDDSIDIVVLDWMMPGFSGIDFLKGKKELGDERAVLMLTALGDQKNVQEALMNGAKDYVVKPIDNKVFVKKINNILGLNSGKKHERNDPRKTMVQNIKTPIVIEDIGRDNISLRSLFPLNIGDTIMLESEALTQRLDIERKKRLPIKVLKHKGSANDYLIKGEFFGLTNTVRQKIVNAYETGMLL